MEPEYALIQMWPIAHTIILTVYHRSTAWSGTLKPQHSEKNVNFWLWFLRVMSPACDLKEWLAMDGEVTAALMEARNNMKYLEGVYTQCKELMNCPFVSLKWSNWKVSIHSAKS